ncbi:acyltransferase [Streptosporangiaceae bacterium NEAU-GS5]|nr:acyltransferase [Streptosporangiaceae bacterium NEAU-GS5]
MAVVFEHALTPLLPEVRAPVKAVFDPGWYGVMVFFLVSGYIVPASLERTGSVRAFWISRVFRLYPLFGLAAAAMALLVALGGREFHVWWSTRPVALALGHLTMLQNLLHMPNLINTMWTLSYEMAFYLLLTTMFVLGIHRKSVAGAFVFALAALVGGPAALLSTGGPGRMLGVALGVTALVAGGIAAVLRGSARVRQAGAIVVGLTVLVLLAVNQSYPGPRQGLLILATMFAGTALYRAERGEIPWRWVGWVALVPLVGMWLARPALGSQTAIAAAWVTFAAGMALRRQVMPDVLRRLGLISYSVYLLHLLLLEVAQWLWPEPFAQPFTLRLAIFVYAVAILLGLSALTWRFVEAPAQRLAKRLTRENVQSSLPLSAR